MDLRRTFIALLAALAVPALALAHEGGVDARGTVASASAAEIVVTKADGAQVRFAVTEKTEVRRGTAPAKLADVQPGERVVVHGRKAPSGPVAFSVRLAKKAAAEK